MDQAEKDRGTIIVLIERFTKQRLPRALEMKKRVDAGESLNQFDYSLLQDVEKEISAVTALVSRNPEYQELAARAFDLWKEILQGDLQNRRSRTPE